jgi:predicted ATPase
MLALRAGITTQAISAIERGTRQTPHPHTVRALASALDLDHQAVADLTALARPRSAAPASGVTPLTVPPTHLYGRENACAEVRVLLRRSALRVLTLTGPGGIGKTRLAAAVAEQHAELYPDSVITVSLAGLHDPNLVMATMGSAFGVRESATQHICEAIQRRTAGQKTLFVLDNFEHLLDAAHEIAELVAMCPDITVLTTSRAPLRLTGEQAYQVPPLDVPDRQDAIDPARALQFPAIELFVFRAKGIDHHFDLTDANVDDVVEICRRLDGIPLAIELAAARTRVLEPSAIRERLERRLELLVDGPRDLPERHRTLRGAIDWSYEICPEPEKFVFRAMGAFVGEAALDAIQAVTGHDDVLAEVSGLVDHSLVMRGDRGGSSSRFRMYETIHEYAREKLEESDACDEILQRHAEWFADIAIRSAIDHYGAETQASLDEVDRERDNIRAALAWLLEGNPEQSEAGIRLAIAMTRYWDRGGHIQESREWLQLALTQTEWLDHRLRSELICALGVNAWIMGSIAESEDLIRDAIAGFQSTDNPIGVAKASWLLGRLLLIRDDHDGLLGLAASLADTKARTTESVWHVAAELLVADAHLIAGDFERALSQLDPAQAYLDQGGFTWLGAWTAGMRGRAHVGIGNASQALAANRAFLAGMFASGDLYGTMDGLARVAQSAADVGEAAVAARLLGAEAGLRYRAGEQAAHKTEPETRLGAELRIRLGELLFAEQFQSGESLEREEAVDLALHFGTAPG